MMKKNLLAIMMASLMLVTIFSVINVSAQSGTDVAILRHFQPVDDDPTNTESIQQRIDDADPGDTIVIESGTYTENIVINKEGITLRSEDGPTKTIIDGGGSGVVIKIETDSVSIYGFTIKNGDVGVNFVSGTVHILINNIISDNDIGVKINGFRTTLIYANDFKNNNQNANDETDGNTWSQNFWDDYNGVDNDGDGFGDTPYDISNEASDPEPKMDAYFKSKSSSGGMITIPIHP